MNRKILVLLILIGIFAVIGVATYAYSEGILESADSKSEVVSEVTSEIASEINSETTSEITSEITKDPNEGVETEVPVTDVVNPSGDQLDANQQYDQNGDLRENSKYLDEDGDTIANFYDICPGVDDFSSECETEAYNSPAESPVDSASPSESASDDENDIAEPGYDQNGDLRADSTYLDDDGDTIANFYDICPGVDDFSSECSTDAYDQKKN